MKRANPEKGNLTIVTFFHLVDGETETIGTIELKDGKLIADPADDPTLQNMLAEPLEVWQEDAPPKSIDPIPEPEAFLKGCLDTFKGSYFWCKEVKDSREGKGVEGDGGGVGGVAR